jgi:hypothetical protein
MILDSKLRVWMKIKSFAVDLKEKVLGIFTGFQKTQFQKNCLDSCSKRSTTLMTKSMLTQFNAS